MVEWIDDLLQRRIFQPLVDFAWVWLGVKRNTLATALWTGCVGVGTHHQTWWLQIIGWAMVAAAHALDIRFGQRPGDRICRLFFLGLFLTETALWLLGDIPMYHAAADAFYIAGIYVRAVDDSKRKRKDWKAMAHKWAESWTWIPQLEPARG